MILYLGNKLSTHGATPTSVETLGARLSELNFSVITKSSFKNKFLRLADMLAAIFKYRKRNPVVLIDTYSTSAFWFAYASAKLCSLLKLAYIPILRGGDLPSRIDGSKNISNSIFMNSFANIAASSYLYGMFRKKDFPVQIIHNYIDILNYPFKIRNKIKPKLLWVRSFHKIYNPELAVLTLKQLSLVYPDATLCMVGPDKDGTMEKCKKLAEELKLSVTFTGRLDKTSWIELSKNYDVFINTTNVDNTPISVMEAMALGLPVVTTNAGGIPYLFNGGTEGIMVSPNSAPEMTQSIISLINDEIKTENISVAARKKAEEWDWKKIGPQWKELLNRANNKSNIGHS